MSQQKVLFLETKQGPLVIRDAPRPTPGAGDVLVNVEAAALNPVDWKIREFGLFIAEYPAILGADGAGTVVELGEGVTNVSKGDKVFFQGFFSNTHATFQQYSVVPAEIVAKIPANVTVEEAASIPSGLATASAALYNRDVNKTSSVGLIAPWEDGGAGRYEGPFVVLGGSSSVGQYVIQVAHLSGFSPIIATASLSNTELLKSLGATHVVDRTLDHDESIATITKLACAPVKFVYDAISEEVTQNIAIDVLAPGGSLVFTLPSELPLSKTTGQTITSVFGNVQPPLNRKFGVKMYSKLTNLLANGSLKPNRVEVLPGGLAGIPGGLERLKTHQVSGKKLVVRPQETVL